MVRKNPNTDLMREPCHTFPHEAAGTHLGQLPADRRLDLLPARPALGDQLQHLEEMVARLTLDRHGDLTDTELEDHVVHLGRQGALSDHAELAARAGVGSGAEL